MQKTWKDEVARDLIAFGSIPFLVITLVRVSIMETYYPMQFIISSLTFLGLRAIFKGTLHAGIGMILVVFTSLFYESWLFSVFALLIYVGIVISLIYLKENKKDLIKGILFGAVSTVVGYIAVRLFFF
ncbi:MAG: hypothetical protein V1863_00565 [Candidatus Omnitrophota bacterium]